MEIIWSAKAKISFFSVIDYLSGNWTKNEMLQFYQRTHITINAIKKNPALFPASSKNKAIRKAIIDKNNSFFYKIDPTNPKIYLLTFFDNRQDPKKLTIFNP
jgi:hypothetical protein